MCPTFSSQVSARFARSTPKIWPYTYIPAILRVQEALEMAAGNVNPQLILADLLRGMREDLVRAA
jgi:hypothetical protein